MVFNRVPWAGLLCAVAGVVACTSVRRVQPAEFIPKNSPEVVWVTYTNSTVVPVAQPEIAGDTLRGMRQGTRKPVAIPLAQVRSVQAKAHDPMKTAIFLTTMGVAAVGAVYFIWVVQAGPGGGSQCGVDVRGFTLLYC
jgi:hypothetical protein